MKLTTLKTADGPRSVAVLNDAGTSRYVDLAAVDPSLPRDLKELLASPDGLVRASAAFEAGQTGRSFATGQTLAPIASPGKIFCIGLNYRDHAIETGAEIPSEPVVFSKFSSTIIADGDEIIVPAAAKQVDYEAELVVVIGRAGKHIAAADALAHVAGYMCGNDVSARDWQKGRPNGQWLLGKTPDTFAPTGPYLTTADEIANPHNLTVTLRLNGKVMQNGSTRDFIFDIGAIIAHISQLVTLEPGDLVFTGTPAGVGAARKPPVFLKAGDEVDVEIAGLGVLRNSVVDERR
ncbi:MAG: fumarylacetoacetate hydrolase family protein [Planctomycetota bacterium]|nr:fumarylacetoacetate hydrolase family protein [Planctomycetaceae bacterium]MDQ3329294.1 fumarylacetoacetate hydrolase family protein [Planctomycetota bacterium]